jgi:hypothetical protein
MAGLGIFLVTLAKTQQYTEISRQRSRVKGLTAKALDWLQGKDFKVISYQ